MRKAQHCNDTTQHDENPSIIFFCHAAVTLLREFVLSRLDLWVCARFEHVSASEPSNCNHHPSSVDQSTQHPLAGHTPTKKMADQEEEYLDEEAIAKRKRREQRPERKVVVRQSDLPRNVQADIIEYAQQAMDEDAVGVQKNLAMNLKLRLDKEQGGTWHVIIGAHFGGNVTSEAQTLINFQLENQWFLMFRSGPPEKKKEHKKEPSQ